MCFKPKKLGSNVAHFQHLPETNSTSNQPKQQNSKPGFVLGQTPICHKLAQGMQYGVHTKHLLKTNVLFVNLLQQISDESSAQMSDRCAVQVLAVETKVEKLDPSSRKGNTKVSTQASFFLFGSPGESQQLMTLHYLQIVF